MENMKWTADDRTIQRSGHDFHHGRETHPGSGEVGRAFDARDRAAQGVGTPIFIVQN